MRESLGTAFVLLVAIAVVGCAGEDRRDAADTGATAVESDTGAAMAGMTGMQGMGSGMMMEGMQSHLRMMTSVGADSMQAMMPIHRQMVANMIAQMNREMRDMNMTGDAGWTATMDSVRQDLIRLPEMSGPELREFMPQHRARVTRLIDAHRAMM